MSEMKNIKIVVDSSADLIRLEGADFASAPLKIVAGEKVYVDNEDIDACAFAEEMFRYNGESSTSCPNVTDWLSAFGDAEEIVCMTITSNLSGTYNTACLAKRIYEEDHPDRRVEVIDTLSAGPEITLMAEKARDLIAEGKSLDEVVAAIRGYIKEVNGFSELGSADY